MLLGEPDPAPGEPVPLRETEVDTEGQLDAEGDAVLLKEATGVRVPSPGDGVAPADADTDTVLFREKEPVTEDEGERVCEGDTLAQLVLLPEREGVTDAEAQPENVGDRLDEGDRVGAKEDVAFTVELLLGAEETLTLKEALPVGEDRGVMVPLGEADCEELAAGDGD